MKRLLGLIVGLIFALPSMAGNVPNGYTELEYIESTGTQYIDTGYYPNSTTSIDYTAMQLENGTYDLFGASETNYSSKSFAIGGYSGGCINYGLSKTVTGFPLEVNVKHKYTLNGVGAYIDDVKIIDTSQYEFSEGNIPRTLFLFAANWGAANELGKHRAYSVKIYENGTLVHDFVPAQNSSGVIGMYDIMDSNSETAFHTNKGSGNFVAGDPVNPCRNLFNKYDSDVGDGHIDAASGQIVGMGRSHTGYILVKPNTTYHVTLPEYQTGSANGIAYYTANKTFVSGVVSGQSYGREPYNFTVPNDDTIVYARLTLTNNIAETDLDAIQIEEGDHGTSYVPYDTMCWCKNLAEPKFAGMQVTGWNGINIKSAGTYSVKLIRKDDWTPPANSYVGLGSVNPGLDPSRPNSWSIKGGWLISNGTISRTFVSAELPGTHQLLGVSGIDQTTFFQHFDVMLVSGSYTASSMPSYEPYNPACFGIKIATTKYNNAAFSSVVTALSNAVDTIKTVVSNTINQATAVANLHSGKQTKPTDTCPSYRQCLLVEDDNGTPHWYVILDPFNDLINPILTGNLNGNTATYNVGYTQLEYIESTGTQYIDTGYAWTSRNRKVEMDVIVTSGTTSSHFFGSTSGSLYDLNPYFSSTAATFTTYIGGGYNPRSISFGTKHNIIWDVKSNRQFDLTIDGNNTTVNVASIPQTGQSVYLLHVGGATGYKPLKAKLYSVKMWDDNVLVRDMVPVRQNSTGEFGMYDKVNNVFYGNANTASGATDFTPGQMVTNDTGILGMDWRVHWNNPNGDVVGETMCISSGSNANDRTLGNACWCKMTGMVLDSQTYAANGAWVNIGVYSTAPCYDRCADACAQQVKTNATNRTAILTVQ